MIEFYLILAAVTTVSVGIFNRLLVGTLVMLIGGYLGEAGVINAMLGFIIGLGGWFYILYEIFMGEAGQKSVSCGSVGAQMAFSACRMIVLVGYDLPSWISIRIFTGGVDAASLNLIYNLADFVNKIAFGVFIWAAAEQTFRSLGILIVQGALAPCIMSNEKAIVIGSVFGGLAIACRLRAMGNEVTLLEKQNNLGGRARTFFHEGFEYDAGPTVITAPYLLNELFEMLDESPKDYFNLLKVRPFYRFIFSDQSYFDYGSSLKLMLDQIKSKY